MGERLKRTVVVTGALGFIGTEVVADLLSRDDMNVIIVDFWSDLINRYSREMLPILPVAYSNMHRSADVLTPDEFLIALNGNLSPDVVIHLGAEVDTHDEGSSVLISRNVRYTRDLVGALRNLSTIPPIIFASSASVYGTAGYPNNQYGLTKSMGEHIVATIPSVCLRFFNVFGRYEHHKGNMASMPFKIAEAYRQGKGIDMHSLLASRDFVPVGNIVTIIVELAYRIIRGRPNVPQGTFDVGTGVSTTFRELDSMVMTATGHDSSVVREVPIPACLIGRYQTFTQASCDRFPNLHCIDTTLISTAEGIKRYYGNH